MLKQLVVFLVLLAGAGLAQAAPYDFTTELDYYTWGESLSSVQEKLGEPYSQDPGGMTYLMDSNWMKQVLTHNGKVYQIIERVIYAQADPAADKEYALIKQNLVNLYGAPNQEDVACPNPQPDVRCKISRWDKHPVTQVFLAQNEDKVISIMLGITSKELREQALAKPESQGMLSVGQLIGAFQSNANAASAKYGGQRVKVMGISGGQIKDKEGKICLRVVNAFNPRQQLLCYYAPTFSSGAWLPAEGSLLVTGIVGEYESGILKLRDCEVINAPTD